MSSESYSQSSPIGALPSGWELKPLKSLCTKIGSGATPRGGKEVYLNERDSHSLIRSQHVHDHHFDDVGLVYISEDHVQELRNVEVQSNDLLLNITGDGVTFSRTCMVPDKVLPACVNQHVAIIRADPSLCVPGYLLAYLTLPAIKTYIESFNSGGSRRAITKGNIESFVILLPPLSVQKQIAKIISTLNDKIANLRQQNETLEKIAQTLFKHWFVDFEFPNEDGKPYRSSGGEMVRSELGEIPVGWRVGKLGDEFEILMGQSPAGSSFNENGEGLLFFQGRTDFGFRFPQARLFTTEPNRIANKYDVLVSVRAPVGDINVASEKCCIGRGLSAVSNKHKSYCLYKLKSYKTFFDVFESEGTIFGAMNKQSFNCLASLIPPEKLIENFNSTVSPLDIRIFVNEKQIKTLTKIRDVVLPKLMSGQIRVRV